MAVKRRADGVVLGEAPEDLRFTLGDLDRGVNFLAPTIGGCTDERMGSGRECDYRDGSGRRTYLARFAQASAVIRHELQRHPSA